jgi:hypothetical protein
MENAAEKSGMGELLSMVFCLWQVILALGVLHVWHMPLVSEFVSSLWKIYSITDDALCVLFLCTLCMECLLIFVVRKIKASKVVYKYPQFIIRVLVQIENGAKSFWESKFHAANEKCV